MLSLIHISYCVMDNEGDSSIVFDEEGQCNYCKDALRRLPKEYFPNQEGKRRLNALMEEIKTNTKNDPYNCMVGAVSYTHLAVYKRQSQ